MSTPTRASTADLARAGERVSEPEEAQSRAQTVDDARESARDEPMIPVEESAPALFAPEKSAAFLRRWDTIQAGFVDEPRGSVEAADALVAETMKQLAETFATERATLEQQWGRGADVSTEDLRMTLRRYRSFFKRLLSV
jgi:hypothetical protein